MHYQLGELVLKPGLLGTFQSEYFQLEDGSPNAHSQKQRMTAPWMDIQELHIHPSD
jgi:hypothetical protein